MNMKSKFAVVAAAGTAFVSTSAFAEGIDVSTVVSQIGSCAAPIAAIGGAVLVVIVGARLWKWIRQAL